MMTFPVMWKTKVTQRSHLHRYGGDCTSWPQYSMHGRRLIHKEQFLAVPVLSTQCKAEFSLGLEALSKICSTVSCHVAFNPPYHPGTQASSEHELDAHAADVCPDQELLLQISYQDVNYILLDDIEILLYLLIIPSKSMEI